MSQLNIEQLKQLRKKINPECEDNLTTVAEVEKAIVEDILSGKDYHNLTFEEVGMLLKILPLPTTNEKIPGVVPQKMQYANISITNWSQEFLMRNILTANVAYLYRSLEEYANPIDSTQEEKQKRKSEYKIIKEFLDRQYEYDANKHVCPLFEKRDEDATLEQIVEKCRNENVEKVESMSVEDQLKSAIKIINDLTDAINNSYESAQLALSNVKKIWNIDFEKCKVNPPYDAFAKFKHFYESNYESIVKAMNAFYGPTSDIGFIVNFHNAFDTEKEAKRWRELNADLLKSDVYTIQNNMITYLGPHKNNKAKIEFYEKNNAFLKYLFEAIDREQELGKELLKRQIITKKKQNVDEVGPINYEKLSMYTKEFSRINELINKEVLTQQEKDELENLRETINAPKDSVEMEVFEPEIGPDVVDLKRSKIYVESSIEKS